MGTQILAGSTAKYIGPLSAAFLGLEAWNSRLNKNCIVTTDTCADSDTVPVLFDGETKTCHVYMHKLEFVSRLIKDY